VSPAVTKYSAAYVAEEPGGEEESGGGVKGEGGTPPTHLSGSGSESEPPGKSEAPKAKIGSHPPQSTRSRTARFAFTASQKGAGFKCKLDRGVYKTCRSPKTYKGLKPGPHSFAVVATAAGEQGPPAKFSWKVLKPKGR